MTIAEAVSALLIVLGFVCAIVGGALVFGGGGALLAVAAFLIYIGRLVESVASESGSEANVEAGGGGLTVFRSKRGE